jgi:hypothetical protein
MDRRRRQSDRGIAWSIGPADGKHFAPSKSPFMVNYRVADLPALLAALRAEGCQVLQKTDDSEYGKFGWVMDGRRQQSRTLATAGGAVKLGLILQLHFQGPRASPKPMDRSVAGPALAETAGTGASAQPASNDFGER